MSEIERPEISRIAIVVALGCGVLPGFYLFITSTTNLVDGAFPYDVKRLLEVFLLTALLIATFLTPALRNEFVKQVARMPAWIRYAWLAIFVLGVVSALLNARSPMHAAYSLLEVALLSLLVIAVLVIAACRSLSGGLFDRIAVTLLALTFIAVGIQEILGVVAAVSQDLEFFFRISLLHFSWPRFYNQVQSWILPVLAALPFLWGQSGMDLPKSRVFHTVVCLLALGLGWYVILMTGGRGVALSVLAALVLGAVFLPASRKLVLVWHIAGIAAGLLVYLAVLQLSQAGASIEESAALPGSQSGETGQNASPRDLFEKQEGTSRFARQSMSGRLTLDSAGRWYMWRGSLDDITSHPILGAGPMNYACTGPDYRAAHPHNFILQFAGEWGLIAATLLLIVLSYFLLSFMRHKGQAKGSKQTRLSSVLLIGVVAAGLYSCLSGVLVMPASQVTGAFICGWLAGVAANDGGRTPSSPKPAVYLLCFASLVALSMSVFSYSEFKKQTAYHENVATIDLGIPRYWQQGKLCKYL